MPGFKIEIDGPIGEKSPDSAWRQAFRRRLTRWFARHARDLPWRRTSDPYAIWVSEVMLQQTQVATVEAYYQRFLRRFPNVASLAAASEQEVLRMWEGLGYYRRARSLHRAARQVVNELNGRFPRDIHDVLSLPGVGRYTAGAILSIALDQRHPILETNTTRLLCRLLAYRGNPADSDGQHLFWSFAEQILPRRRVGLFNQALMELGSLVCVPRKPACNNCPVRTHCAAHAQGLQASIPVTAKKVSYKALREAAVVVRRCGKVLLRRCGPDERWAGLWDFPRFQIATRQAARLQIELRRKTRDLTGIDIQPAEHVTTIKHGVTRYRITLECYTAAYDARVHRRQRVEQKWVSWAALDTYPLSVTGRKISCLDAIRSNSA